MMHILEIIATVIVLGAVVVAALCGFVAWLFSGENGENPFQ